MQNKPNLPDDQMSVRSCFTMNYEQITMNDTFQNKPNLSLPKGEQTQSPRPPKSVVEFSAKNLNNSMYNLEWISRHALMKYQSQLFCSTIAVFTEFCEIFKKNRNFSGSQTSINNRNTKFNSSPSSERPNLLLLGRPFSFFPSEMS